MLFKKTLKVALATALWMVALLGANSAMAQIRTYSAETLMGAGPNYPIEYGAALTADARLGPRALYYLSNAAPRGQPADPAFVRVSRSGTLVFTGQPTAAPLYQVDVTVPCLVAGTAWDANVEAVAGPRNTGWVFPVTAALPAPSVGDALPENCEGTATTATLVGVRATIAHNTATEDGHEFQVTGMGAAGISVGVYDEKVGAHFADVAPYDGALTGGTFVNVQRSVKAASASGASPVTSTASAVSRFTDIAGFESATAPYEVNLGGFIITVNPKHYDASTGTQLPQDTPAGDGTAAVPMEMERWMAVGLRASATKTNGTTRFESPGGWGFAQGFRFAGDANCALGKGPDGSAAGAVEGNGPGIMSSPLSETGATADVVGGIKEAAWYLCASVAHDNDEAIPAGFYTLDVNLTQPPGSLRPFAPQGMAGIVAGRIKHDGTTVHIPFVTSYEPYTQRIIIVNRNKVDVSYSIAFRTEGDGTLTGDNPYTGMAMGGQNTVVKVADLVTFGGGKTRGSATVTVAAKSSTIDVATTLVSKMDQSTDTVVLEAEPN